MEQINRIRKMERKLNLALKAVRRLEVALNQFEMLQSDINELDEYYGSEEWKADRAAEDAESITRIRACECMNMQVYALYKS